MDFGGLYGLGVILAVIIIVPLALFSLVKALKDEWQRQEREEQEKDE